MNKAELIAKVAQKTEMTKKDTEKIVSAVWDTIIEEVAEGNKIQIIGFGTFEQRIRKEHIGRKPGTDEQIIVPESKIPAFKPGKTFKDTVNQ